MNDRFTLINARIGAPPYGEELAQLQITAGRWHTIAPQSHLVEEPSAIPITELRVEDAMDHAVVDLQGRMLLPGLVDSHMHLDKSFSLPQVGNVSGTLSEAVRNYAKASPFFEKEEIKARIVRASLQALSFGSTTLRSHLDFNLRAGREVALRTIEAALEARELVKPYIDIQYFPMCPLDQLDDASMAVVEEALRMGVDGLGGAPHLSSTPEADIERIFELAVRYGCPIDLHADESDDPNVRTVLKIAELTQRYDYQGKVSVGHLCSLASMNAADAALVIDSIAKAQLKAVSLPAANLYLQGRGDSEGPIRRGVTRIRQLRDSGVTVAVASDNIHDPFHPFGRGDLLQIALLAGYAGHLGSCEDMRTLLELISTSAADYAGVANYGIATGNPADFVVIDAAFPEEAFTMLPASRWVSKGGRWVSCSTTSRQWGNKQLEQVWQNAASRVQPGAPIVTIH